MWIVLIKTHEIIVSKELFEFCLFTELFAANVSRICVIFQFAYIFTWECINCSYKLKLQNIQYSRICNISGYSYIFVLLIWKIFSGNETNHEQWTMNNGAILLFWNNNKIIWCFITIIRTMNIIILNNQQEK